MLGSVLEGLGGVRGWLTGKCGLYIDTPQSRLQSEITVFILACVSALTAVKQYLGDPIHCIFDGRSGVKTEAIDAFCWIHATAPLEPALVARLTSLSPSPPHLPRLCTSHHSHLSDTAYYQWVHVFIILQAGMFLVPSRLWVWLEGGRVHSLHLPDVVTEYKNVDKWRPSVDTFVYSFHQNNFYFFKYIMCEVVQVVVVLVVAYLTDQFLGGQFYGLGSGTLAYALTSSVERRDMVSPACQVFPTVTSCQFPTGSLTGTVNVDHALCVLSLNIINDKIFLLEWFWFLLVGLVSASSLVWRLLSLLFPIFRVISLKSADLSFAKEDERLIKRIVKRCQLGDWFLLTQVRRNLPDRSPFIYITMDELIWTFYLSQNLQG